MASFARLRRITVAQRLLGLLLLAALPLLAGCIGQSTTSSYDGPMAKVSLALDWTPNTNHTGVYVAMQKGYYRQNGIDLALTPYSSSVYPEQLVGTGKAEFGISFPESVTTFRAQDVPIVSVGAIIEHNTSALITLKSSGLDSVAKLAGKRYAGFGGAYEQPVISQMLSCGGAPRSDFQNITTQLDPIAALKSGQFDFAWVYMGWEGIEAQQQGVALNVFPLTDYCIPDYSSPVVITNQQFIQQHPDIIKRFMKATAEGYEYAIQHPGDAAKLLIDGAPKGSFDDQQLVYKSQAYLSPLYAPGEKCWGMQSLAAWTNYPRFMFNHQAIQDANGNPITQAPDYSAAFTNQFLPACS
ncbi:MAG TPA: ABC transporter substrate-binding protein [Ktedonobacterales bacterium]|nr:ABC transporter substrate-binding protein [Ktedonobacterales bacterium]